MIGRLCKSESKQYIEIPSELGYKKPRVYLEAKDYYIKISYGASNVKMKECNYVLKYVSDGLLLII